MRYRYDGANQRTVKESFEATSINTASRVALFVFPLGKPVTNAPGDFERRGLVRNTTTYDAVTTGVDATETRSAVRRTSQPAWSLGRELSGTPPRARPRPTSTAIGASPTRSPTSCRPPAASSTSCRASFWNYRHIIPTERARTSGPRIATPRLSRWGSLGRRPMRRLGSRILASGG
jgi:hypothetical protein